jgi:hypothetical protein
MVGDARSAVGEGVGDERTGDGIFVVDGLAMNCWMDMYWKKR